MMSSEIREACIAVLVYAGLWVGNYFINVGMQESLRSAMPTPDQKPKKSLPIAQKQSSLSRVSPSGGTAEKTVE